jgi:hypothetical protein
MSELANSKRAFYEDSPPIFTCFTPAPSVYSVEEEK